MNFLESPEHLALRRAVRSVMSSFDAKYFAAAAREGTKTDELWKALSAAGFAGIGVPEQYGGGGGGVSELAIVAEEVAHAGCPLLSLVVSCGIAVPVITKYGTEDQRKRWLPGLAEGSLRFAFALTEPDAGTNTHRITTRARRRGSGYVIAGTKCYISAVDEADAIMVVARSSEATQGGEPAGPAMFIVDVETPGLHYAEIPLSIVSPEKQFMLFLDDVEVDGDRLLGSVDATGWNQLFDGLNPERIVSAATVLGLARYGLARASTYARQRQVWSAPIGAHQGISHPLAKAHIATELASLMTARAAWEHDHLEDASASANMAKYAAAEAASASLDQAIQVHGGNGLSTEYALADYWGIVRLFGIAPVSREMVLNHVAQHQLGLPRSY